MNDLFTTKGTLTVSVGEGYLSSFEVSTLKKGDIVRTTKIAGYPSHILFNGIVLCPCEVVILDDIFGVRVTEPTWQEPVVPAPKTRDDLVEILPTLVSLGTIRMSLAELKAAGPGTIISLGKPFSSEVDVELSVAGIPVASGKAVVMGEEMGMRVTEVFPFGSIERNVRASGYLVEPESAGAPVKDYDFKRPDKFTRAQIDRMRDIHTLFFRNLKARFPRVAPLLAHQPLPFVDQLTYGELMDELAAAGSYNRIVLRNASQRGDAETFDAASHPVQRVAALMEEEGTPYPVVEKYKAFVEKYVSETPTRMPIIFGYEDCAELNALFGSDEGRGAVLACLRGGWKNLVDMRLATIPLDDPRARAEAIPRNEMIVVVSVAGKARAKGILLVYPFLTLEPYLGILG